MKMTILSRILLLLTALLAAYLIAFSIEGLTPLSIIFHTIAFGVLLVAGLLLIIFGFGVLESPLVVVISTLIPLFLSLGLVTEFLSGLFIIYLIFCILGLLAILLSRLLSKGRLPALILAVVHGIAGMVIFLLPIILTLKGQTSPAFAWVGIGGALIGVGGLLLSFLKAGKPILSREQIFTVLPLILLLMTLAFTIGYSRI